MPLKIAPAMQLRMLIFFGTLLICPTLFAQNKPTSVTQQIVNSVNAYADSTAMEKLYLQTDKPTYNSNDTLWFKGYLFNAANLNASRKSGVLYLEIADEQNLVVKRTALSVYLGQFWGNITLDAKAYPAGIYTLRAYTNWMRNYSETFIFKKQFSITNIEAGDGWLFNTRLRQAQSDGKPGVGVNLNLTDLQQRALAMRDVEVSLTDGRRNWYRNKMTTGVEGALDFNFQLPEKADANKLSIKVRETKKDGSGATYLVPVVLNRKDHTDLQFMPEGGALVAGLKSKIAFKAIAEDGSGTDVSGVVYDSKQQQVTTFKSTHLGMGHFEFQPQSGETYSAIVKFDANNSKAYTLPTAKASGIVMQVNNVLNSDSLNLSFSCTADIQQQDDVYYLIGQARGVGCFGMNLYPSKNFKTINVAKNLFPSGISKFTLLDKHARPVAERLIFLDHDDRLCVNVGPSKKAYDRRDSVNLDITVTDKTGAPVAGIFNMAVTDDAQVKLDPLRNGTIVSHMLLTSDLKGEVENPGYYFQSKTEETAQQLDDLLLTQGWVNYDWTAALSGVPLKPVYPAEEKLVIKGKVTNIFNKPVANSGVVLLSKKPVMFKDTVTNAVGEFTFKNILPADTAAYVIQARNKNGKSFNVGVEVQEFVPPEFKLNGKRIIPAYVNLDSTNLKTVSNRMAYKLEQEKLMGMHQLKEVIVKDKKVVKESKNLNGPGEADFTLDEADIEKARKATLGEILQKSVPGFMQGPYRYTVRMEYLVLIMDGINVLKNSAGASSQRDLYDQSFNYFTAEDIKGIEVMHPGRNGSRYFFEHILPMSPLADPNQFCFIEVTTRAGNGPFFKATPGVYVYKPIPFTVPTQFYSPKYTSKNKSLVTDIRSTLYWQPNIITDKNGKAQVSFYTSDKAGTYTVMMEGTDMQGSFESTMSKVTVK